MEIMIDEHAIRLLRRGSFTDDEMRLVVAALKITNDLERIGDIAVNLAERVISLREMPDAKPPEELAPMVEAVRSMVSRSLGSLIFRNAELAAQVLESDDVVDQYRDRIFENLLLHMTENVALVTLPECSSCWPRAIWSASRITPRISPKTSSSGCAGLDVRHGLGLTVRPESNDHDGLSSEVTENSTRPSFGCDSELRNSARLNFTQCPTLGTVAPLAPVPTSSLEDGRHIPQASLDPKEESN